MSDENDNGRSSGGRQPLTLKPRAGGSVSSGTVKQSFSHGRTKTVVVETKRARTHVPGGGNLAAPSAAERRVFEPQRPAPPPPGARAPQPNDGLSAEERAARAAVVERAREQQARVEAERRAREERTRAEAESARAAEAPPPAAPAAEAPAPAPPAATAPAEPPPPAPVQAAAP